MLVRRAYGLANLETRTPMRPEMVFELGSVTKQFTSTAILMLAQQGKLALDDDIRKYLPGLSRQGCAHHGRASADTYVRHQRLYGRSEVAGIVAPGSDYLAGDAWEAPGRARARAPCSTISVERCRCTQTQSGQVECLAWHKADETAELRARPLLAAQGECDHQVRPQHCWRQIRDGQAEQPTRKHSPCRR